MGIPPPHDAAAPLFARLRRSTRARPQFGRSALARLASARSTLAPRLPYAYGLGVGVLFAGMVLGWDVISGDPQVVRQVAGDNAAGLAAFRVFIDDTWRWPVLAAPTFGDSGVNVAFSDSIPLLAVVAKLARPLGIGAEAWWGGWFGIAYGAQGVAAVFAVRSWGARSLAPQLAAPALALSMPVLLLQTVHPSLSAHSAVLLAWGLAGRCRSERNVGRRWYRWLAVLTCASIAVHPYLGAMVAVMAVGVIGDGLVTDRLRVGDAARWVAVTAVTIGSWLAVGGYLAAAGASEGGYGQYTTSVLGPVVPTLSSILDGEPTTFEIEPSHPGYAYLGLGVIGLVLLAARLQRRRLATLLRHNQLVAVAVGLLACWAISPWVRLTTGDRLDLPHALAVRLGSPRRAGAALSLVGVFAACALLVRLLRPAARRQAHRPSATVGVAPSSSPSLVLADPRATSTRSGGPRVAKRAATSARTVVGGPWDRQNRPGDGEREEPATFRPALGVTAASLLVLGALGLGTPQVIGSLMSQFRASGRFAWPLLYGVLTFAVAAVDARQLGWTVPPRTAPTPGRSPAVAHVASAALLVTAVLLQLADTAVLRRFARELLLPGGSERQQHVAVLVDLVAAHDRVVLGPDFRCTYYPDGVGAFIDMTGAASAARRPIDRIYAARQPQTGPCAVEQRVDLSDPGALIVLVEPVAVRTDTNRGELIDQRCRQRGTLNVCSHRWPDVPPDVLAHFGPVDD